MNATETRRLSRQRLRALMQAQIAMFERYRQTRAREGYEHAARYFAGRIDSLEAILERL